MILGSAFCLSTSGVGLRVIEEADGWQILFYRSLSMMALILIVLLLRRSEKWPAPGPSSLGLAG